MGYCPGLCTARCTLIAMPSGPRFWLVLMTAIQRMTRSVIRLAQICTTCSMLGLRCMAVRRQATVPDHIHTSSCWLTTRSGSPCPAGQLWQLDRRAYKQIVAAYAPKSATAEW